jgi:hypothetical protein
LFDKVIANLIAMSADFFLYFGYAIRLSTFEATQESNIMSLASEAAE